MLHHVPKLLRNDATLILRNSLLIMILVMALAMGVAARFALPALDASLAAQGIMPAKEGGVRFSETYALWVVFIGLWQASMLPGTVFGFLLLDEKEDETLLAMRVSPVPMRDYVLYRISLPWLLATIYGVVIISIIDIAVVDLWRLVLISACSGLIAPVTMMALATFAANKVQGLAMTKFTGIAGLVLLASFFVDVPLQWCFAIFPPFLVAKGYWLALEPDGAWVWLASALGGALLLLVLLVLIARRFVRRVL